MTNLTLLLLDAAIKSAAVLTIAFAALALLPRLSAATRHALLTLTIVGSLLLPALTILLPAWRVLPPIATQRAPAPAAVAAPAPALPSNPLTNHAVEHTATDRVAPALTAQPIATPQPAPVAPAAIDVPTRLLNHLPQLWLLGSILALSPLALGLISLRHLRRTARRIRGGSQLTHLEQGLTQLQIRRSVTLLESPCRTMPMTFGLFRPTILLPEDARAWSSPEQRAVILHELAHIKRLDCLTQLLTRLACALYWFNPLIWLAARRMIIERERACDDLVLTTGTRSSDYAEQLLQIASNQRPARLATFAGIAMARRSGMEGRLLAILDERRNRRTLSRFGAALAIAALAAVLLPVAMLRAQDAQSTSTPQASTANDENASAEQSSDTPATATLPNGITIQILGVTDPNAPNQWWTASGQPSLQQPKSYEGSVQMQPAAHEIARTFLVQITDVPEDFDYRATWQVEPAGGSTSGSTNNQREGVHTHEWSSAFPESTKSATLRVGVANDNWQTLASHDGRGQTSIGVGEHGFAFSESTSHDGGTRVIVTHDVRDRPVRIVAIDKNGEKHVGDGGSIGSGDFTQMTANVPDLPLEDIQTFEIQAADYQWAAFQNISLHPGQTTNAQAKQVEAPTQSAPALPQAQPQAEPQAQSLPDLPYDTIVNVVVPAHVQTLQLAAQQNIRANSRIFGVTEDLQLFTGGLLTYINKTNQPQQGWLHLGNFGSEKPDVALIGPDGQVAEYELRERNFATIGKWGLWWHADRAIAPGETLLFGYVSRKPSPLPGNDDSARLVMQNHFGGEVLENFFLVLPDSLTLSETPIPSNQVHDFPNLKIHHWQRHIPRDTTNTVSVVITKRAADAPAPAPPAKPQTNTVYITGEIDRAGAYVMPDDGLTLLQLLATTGGEVSDPQKAQGLVIDLVRINPPATTTYNIEDILSGPAARVQLQPGDVLVVRRAQTANAPAENDAATDQTE